MKPTRIWTLIFFMVMLAAPSLVFAHGGEKHDDHDDSTAEIEEAPAVGSPFKESVEEVDMPAESGEEKPVDYIESEGPVDYGTTAEEPTAQEPPSLGLGDDPLGLGPDSLEQEPGSMEHAGHDMAGMNKEEDIVQATHEMVSTSNKGYGLAVGITVLSGLAAGFLFLKRPTDS